MYCYTDTYNKESGRMTIRLISFGYSFMQKDTGQPVAPEADITRDVRISLRNPAAVAILKMYGGKDKEIQDHVLATPGVDIFILELITEIRMRNGSCTVAIGCVAGRHRSAALVEIIAKILDLEGHETEITHMHLERALRNEPLT